MKRTLYAGIIALVLSSVSYDFAWGLTCQELFVEERVQIARVQGAKEYAQFKKAVFKNLKGPTEETDLFFRWNIPFPSFRRIGPDAVLQFNLEGKPNRDYEGTPYAPERPFVAISRLFGRTAVNSDTFYHKVYAHYDGVIREQLIRDLHQIDSELMRERLSIGYIHYASEAIYADVSSYVGTIRVYDGSQKPWGLQHLPGKDGILNEKGDLLPFERINRRRRLPKLEIEKRLDQERASGRKIFEIGKFSLEGPPEVRPRARNLIELFLMRFIVEPHPDALVVVHIASQAHARLYHSRYGFEIAEEFDVPGSKEKEAIMITTGRDLYEKLRKLHEPTLSAAE